MFIWILKSLRVKKRSFYPKKLGVVGPGTQVQDREAGGKSGPCELSRV